MSFALSEAVVIHLEIIFADLEKVGAHKSFEEFEADYLAARTRLEKANGEAYTAPEWCFRRADGHLQKPSLAST
jgi:hypothetical protein